jgi:light-regulated signal transduction histidine kinase (bacteriophytochrome)
MKSTQHKPIRPNLDPDNGTVAVSPETSPTLAQSLLDNCDREPMQFISRIQSQGNLIAFDLDTGVITSCSENSRHFLQQAPEQLLGQNIGNLSLTEHLAGDILKRLKASPEGTPTAFETATADGSAPSQTETLLDVAAHHYKNTGFLEFLPSVRMTFKQYRERVRQAQSAITKILNAESFEAGCQIAVEAVAQLTGYDRVQLYKFHPNSSGEVTHEWRAPEMPTYLGLFFPASDIPPSARELYRLNPTRAIFNALDFGAPLVHVHDQTLTPDLTFATLRSVSPVHLQYLKHMGVKASMSISCLKGANHLWGLICGHHKQPKILSLDERNICKSIADTLMLKLNNSLNGKFSAALACVRKIESNFADRLSQTDNISKAFYTCCNDIMALYPAQGLALSYRNQIFTAGQTPPDPFLTHIFTWLRTKDLGWFSTTKLWEHIPAAKAHLDTACGILTQRIDRGAHCQLVWFKPSAPTAIRWAGNPYQKTLLEQNDRVMLSPRHSFEQWSDENERSALAWPENSQRISKEIFSAMFTIIESRAAMLEKLNKALTRSNADLEQYAYAASHDLKSPLRAIDNLAQWLTEDLDGKLSPDDRTHFAEIRSRVDRMENLLDDFLDYASLDSKLNELGPQLYCQGANLIEDIQLLLAQQDNKYELTIDDDLKQQELPRQPLLRVLLNLISNALRHNDKAIPKIHIGMDSHDGFWTFNICDNGPGVDKMYSERIFEPYEKLESRDIVEGSGLGLSIARKITESLGGTLYLRTEMTPRTTEHPDLTGCCFELTWPKHAN